MSDYTPTETQAAFMLDNHYVRVLAGPVGGGKSVTCVHELVKLACGQNPNAAGVRKTRAVIVRNTADQLALTTRKTVFDWLPPGAAGVWKSVEKTFILKGDLPDGTRVESEWLFIALDTPDDVRKALSLETTFLWGNECRELHPDVVDGLLGRLNRYPSPKDGGPTRSCAIFDTNMPDEETWWWDMMENPPSNWAIFKQPPAILRKAAWVDRFGGGAMTIQTMQGPLTIDPDEPLLDKDGNEWLVNPEADNVKVLNPNYYPNLIPGKTEDWLRVYLRSEYGRSLSGTPVYEKSFTADFHIAKDTLKPIRGESYPVIIGLDFGRTPAAVFKQRDPRGRVLTLGEVTAENMGIETFINTKLNPYIANRFQGCTFVCAPDPAGFAKQQLNEMTLVDALKKAGFKCVRPPTNDPERRIQAVERLLLMQTEGKAMYLIDPSCEMLIKGFRYGYRYKIKKNGEMEDRPEKNKYSHCFVAGTPVATPDGERPIESLKPGDWVLTRSGPREVLGAMSRLSSDLVAVEANGRTVLCTADHPFIVDGEKVRADALKYVNILECEAQNTPSKSSTALGSTESPLGTTNPTVPTGVRTCTGTSGSTTTGLFPQGTTCTTKTMTGATTPSTTSNCCTKASMQPCTENTGLRKILNKLRLTWTRFARKPPNGTSPTRVESGTSSTENALGKISAPNSTSAHTAGANTTGTLREENAGFARQSASLPPDAPAGLTTSSGLARTAVDHSTSTSTQRHVTVASAAVQRIVALKPVVVYDLTVADDHEFFVAGMLVSNCHDANQYADSVIDMGVRGVAMQSGKRTVEKVRYAY